MSTLPAWARPNPARAMKRPSWIARPNARPLSLVPPPPSSRPVEVPRSESFAPRAASVAPRLGSVAPAREGSVAPARRLSLVPALPDPRIAALEGAVAQLTAEIATLRQRVIEDSEPELVRLALTIAERVVGREISVDPELIASWVEEAIATLGARHAVTIAVSPDLASIVEGATVDASLPPGSCEVRDGARMIDVGARARIDAMTDALEVDR
jgi:hypothetical protein